MELLATEVLSFHRLSGLEKFQKGKKLNDFMHDVLLSYMGFHWNSFSKMHILV